MTDREDAQAAVDALAAKQGVSDSVTPLNLSADQLQVLLDKALMQDEALQVTELDPVTYGNFNHPSWGDLTSGFYSMLGATDAQLLNYAPSYKFLAGGGITYDFPLMRLINVTGEYVLEVYFSSNTDLLNDSRGRTTIRMGVDWGSSTAVPWVETALLSDTETQEVANAQSLVAQNPVGLDTPIQMEFGGSQNIGGSIELQTNGTIQFNEPVVSTQAISVQYGRVGASGTSVIWLYATVNPTGSADPLADIPTGRMFVVELQNANVDLFGYAQNNYLQIPITGLQLKYWIVRDSSGANSGGLLPRTASFDHFGASNPVPDSSSAGLSVWKVGELLS